MTVNVEPYMADGIKLLDHGFVRLVDWMGDDLAIVNAARVSYASQTKKRSSDRHLLRHLLRHWHTTPFEQCVLKIHVRAPIFVYRQWHRHRTQSYNEESGRYSVLKDEFYLPELVHMCEQSNTNKQGRGDELASDVAADIAADMSTDQKYLYDHYRQFLDAGLARELARNNLPVSTYSSMYSTANLLNWFKFLLLRQDHHAQWEIRQYANAICTILEALFPWAVEAYVDYWREAVTFSRMEIERLRAFLAAAVDGGVNVAGLLEPLSPNKKGEDRELDEFKEKLRCLG